MTLRIHFTAEDLARTRLASGVRPLLELGIGIRLLQERSHPVRFDAWRRRAAAGLRPRMLPLFDFIPALGASVGFLDMSGPEAPDAFREMLAAAPRQQIIEDLDRWAAGLRHIPKAARQLRDDPLLVRHLASAVHEAHEFFIAPYWPKIEQLAGSDRTLRLQQLAEHGVERLLRELNPRYITWASPVLHLTTASNRDGDVHLAGRGLLLIPSVFGAHYPAFDHPDDGQPWITFPVRGSAHAPMAPAAVTAGVLSDPPASLRALLGRTRSTVLWAIAEHVGCTTTQLAALVGISPASASEHASVLRSAGLTVLTRDGKCVRHALSNSGQALLDSAGA
ncbi:winged helix-turn-helix transcriptional regulator [Streptomyces actinomycinicus]|uniref:Winged helix-turn-helix transcriptional regulator n=1 Tax=Streptomyces actinomycinicus TaxID=1695166 RepID=A0A937JSZ8_9ACTN|nr:winged helix-turn-helix domain-containing protein [Streptomyces actinomycinicus]MBL1087267.1 winged helix-turn-helix transcriptional regulator [Streptomyces actinomycinicus]